MVRIDSSCAIFEKKSCAIAILAHEKRRFRQEVLSKFEF